MTEFDPDRFENKYVHYLDELDRAYRNAFEYMNENYNSTIVHAIDQQLLDDSEPIYSEEAGFQIELPADPRERLTGIPNRPDMIDSILETYIDRLEQELESVFRNEDGG